MASRLQARARRWQGRLQSRIQSRFEGWTAALADLTGGGSGAPPLGAALPGGGALACAVAAAPGLSLAPNLAMALPLPAVPAERRRRAREAGDEAAAAEKPVDEEAFARLYREVAAPLAAYARRTLGDADEARDVMQEVFFRYLRAGLPAGTAADTARPYLFRSASHLMRDRWRRGARDRRWRESQAAPATPTPPRDRTLAADLDRALSRLKPRDRALLWLAHVEGASHREVAAALDLGEASVRVMLFRARKRLAKVLDESDFPTEEWR